jgi:hypothetical protein
MPTDERGNRQIVKDHPRLGTTNLDVVKGTEIASSRVEGLIRRRTVEEIAEDVTFYHEPTSHSVTKKPNKHKGKSDPSRDSRR